MFFIASRHHTHESAPQTTCSSDSKCRCKECSTSVLTGENLQRLLKAETWQMTGMSLRLPHGFAVKFVVVCHALHPSSVQQTCSLRSVQNTCLSVVATTTSFGLMLPAVTICWSSFGTAEQCLAEPHSEVLKPQRSHEAQNSGPSSTPRPTGPIEYVHLGFQKPEKGGPGPHWPVAAKESVDTSVGLCVCRVDLL